MADQEELKLTEIAKRGYAIWRGTHRRNTPTPQHWDDLAPSERESYAAVVAFAVTYTRDAIAEAS